MILRENGWSLIESIDIEIGMSYDIQSGVLKSMHHPSETKSNCWSTPSPTPHKLAMHQLRTPQQYLASRDLCG